MFDKKRNPSQEKTEQAPEESTDESQSGSENTLPLVYPLEYPYKLGTKTVSELRCESRPRMRTLRRILAAGDDDAEIMEIVFEELYDIVPSELEKIDLKDGVDAMTAVFDFFPHLRGS